jgi:hypothetical protein
MVWLLIGYMSLFIHRPFEIWPVLGDFHLERVYILAVFAYWLVYPGKRWLPNAQHGAYVLFAMSVGTCWVMSPWMEQGQQVVENWFKIVFFYVLFVTVVHDEKQLKHLAWGFLLVMGLYMGHSFWEYLNGRHTYRMGISRLIGVDSSLGDPNSFGASIVFAMPFVTAFWNTNPSKSLKLALIAYFTLSVGCIMLTGSRSSFLCLLMWAAWMIARSSYRWKALAGAIVSFPLVFMVLPESLQNRFETIVNPDVGPENAKVSGQGRIDGLLTGFELLSDNPLNGVGPGAWRPATGSEIESHNLLGQLAGEMGLMGLMSFGFVLCCFWSNLRWMKRRARAVPGMERTFLFELSRSVGTGVVLMLAAGMFGHNLFRHNWLWYGGFLIIARFCVARELASARGRVAVGGTWRVVVPQPGLA